MTFQILAAESGWDESTLQAVFLKGLSGDIKDELAVRDEISSLRELMELATRLDNRMRERRRERTDRQRFRSCCHSPAYTTTAASSPPPPSPRLALPEASPGKPAPASQEEPMQLGRAWLAPAERQRHLRNQLCIYCAQEGHFLAQCPEVPKDQARQ